MKIGIAQINTTVGDLSGNKRRILDAYQSLVATGAELVIFPEMAICGYPPRDLLLKTRFVADTEQTLNEVVREIAEVPAVIGCVERCKGSGFGQVFYNAAAWCESGRIRIFARKSLLPNYDVFDEERYFEPATSPTLYQWNGKKIGITICEDIWNQSNRRPPGHYRQDPVAALTKENPDLLLNLSASPWYKGKNEIREQLVQRTAERCACPVVYCNAVGGNDELIFDGGSIVVHHERGLIAGLNSFRESYHTVVDLENSETEHSEHFNLKGHTATQAALSLGLRDYARKSGFRKALIGLSGGIDSALVAALASQALGPQNVIGIALPSSISSQHSRDDAGQLAQNLGIEYHEVPITPIVESAEFALGNLFSGMKADVTEENIQARARGLLLMAVSNKLNALLLTTGNKSEIAVGYCTLYGDMCGGLAVISDLPKMEVYALAKHMNLEREIIPAHTIQKPPSAELRPDQLDEDSLPPYPILDSILHLYIEKGLSRREITEHGFEKSLVYEIVKKVDLNEYKRKQAPPGLKTTPLAFGTGRRMPIVHRYTG